MKVQFLEEAQFELDQAIEYYNLTANDYYLGFLSRINLVKALAKNDQIEFAKQKADQDRQLQEQQEEINRQNAEREAGEIEKQKEILER